MLCRDRVAAGLVKNQEKQTNSLPINMGKRKPPANPQEGSREAEAGFQICRELEALEVPRS